MIPYVGWVATGVNPGRVAVDVACGAAPVIKPYPPHVAAIRFFYPERNATVVSVSVNDRMLPPAVNVGAVAGVAGAAIGASTQ